MKKKDKEKMCMGIYMKRIIRRSLINYFIFIKATLLKEKQLDGHLYGF